jgi:hypothetical protein
MLVMTTATGKAVHAVTRDGKNSPCNVANRMHQSGPFGRTLSQVSTRVAGPDAVTCKRCLKMLAEEIASDEYVARHMNEVLTAARATGQPVMPRTGASLDAAKLLVRMGLLLDTPDGFMDPVAQHHPQYGASTTQADALEGKAVPAEVIVTELSLEGLLATPEDAKPRTFPWSPEQCPGFDAGGVLAGYDGRECVNCGVREPNGYTSHGLRRRDDALNVEDLPEAAAAIELLVQGVSLADTVHLLETATLYGSSRTWSGGKEYRVQAGTGRRTFRVFPRLEAPIQPDEAGDEHGQRPDGSTVHADADRGPDLTREQAAAVLVRGGLTHHAAIQLMSAADSLTTLKAEMPGRGGRRYQVTRRWLSDKWRVAVIG